MNISFTPVVIQPHTRHWLEAHGSSQQGANKGDQVTENRDGAGDNIRDQANAESATKPHDPVSHGVCCKMAGALENANENVFAGNLVDKLVEAERQGGFGIILTWIKSKVLAIKPGRANP